MWGTLAILVISFVQADLNFQNFSCDNEAGRFCGNDGICLSTGICECAPYWSTLTDFVEVNDCANNIIGIYFLWSLNLLALIWLFYQSLGVILVRFEVFLETRRNRKGYNLYHNKGLLGIILYFGISTPFHLIMCIVHLVDPLTRVGFDLLPTLCFFFGKIGFYTMIFFVQGSMLSATLKSEKKQRALVKGNYVFQFTVNTLSSILGTLGFVTYAALQDDVPAQLSLMQGYYLAQSVALFGAALGAVIVTSKVNKAFSRGADLLEGSNPSNSKGEQIRKKVNDLQRTSMIQGLLQGFVYLIMGAVPFFINKHSYFLPISWLAMPVIGKKLAHQFLADPNSKNVLQRLGLKKTTDSRVNTGENNDQLGVMSNNTTLNGRLTNLGSPMSQMKSADVYQSENPVFSRKKKHVSESKKKNSKRIQEHDKESSFMSSTGALLEDLLSVDHPLHGKFIKFVQSRHAQNEVALLELCIQYKQVKDNKERMKLGKSMVKDFVETDATKQVDLPHEMREILLSTAKRTQFVPTTFDQIRRTLAFDLKGNFLSQFERQVEKEEMAIKMKQSGGV